MRSKLCFLAGLLTTSLSLGTVRAAALVPSIDVAATGQKLDIGYHYRGPNAQSTDPGGVPRTVALGTTLPHWGFSYSSGGQTGLNVRLLGSNPFFYAGTTTIPVVLVPVRLSVAGVAGLGHLPLVQDASTIISHVLASPIFSPGKFSTGSMQFGDALVRSEFPTAPSGWHLQLAVSVGAVLNISATTANVTTYLSRSGSRIAVITDHAVLDNAFAARMASYGPNTLVMFITYNAPDSDALGYHTSYGTAATGTKVFGFSTWFENVSDIMKVPITDSVVLSHEVAEIIHDPFMADPSTSVAWGDPFQNNACQQADIEVGDAVEYAPAVQRFSYVLTNVNGQTKTYTLQNMALLQWFMRIAPSGWARNAYSFPSPTTLTSAAPVRCT